MPEVSIIMPVHNGEQYLADAITSVLEQTYHDWELIIVDDGSTDQTSAIIQAFRDRDPRVRSIENAKNLGLVESLNVGLNAAHGKVIARQDADDLSAPDRLKTMVNFLSEHPGTGLVGTNGHYIDAQGAVLGTSHFPTDHEAICAAILNGKSPFFHGSWMFRRECLEKVGFYNNLLFSGEDKDLWLRISEQYETRILPERLYYYRVHQDAFTTQFSYPRKVMREMVLTLARERRLDGIDGLGLRYGERFEQSGIPEHLRAATRYLVQAAIYLQKANYAQSAETLLKAVIQGYRFPLIRKLVLFFLGTYLSVFNKRAKLWLRAKLPGRLKLLRDANPDH